MQWAANCGGLRRYRAPDMERERNWEIPLEDARLTLPLYSRAWMSKPPLIITSISHAGLCSVIKN